MSETLFKFLLSEVQAVRVTCQHKQNGQVCGATVEVPLSQLDKVQTCPVCGNSFVDKSYNNNFSRFARSVEDVVGMGEGTAKVELVLLTKVEPK
jgi:hypothetical protein